MHRLTVVILATVDAAIAAAVGIAATLAPLTLLWVLGLGGTAQWAALWPASATIWQFGNLVPLQVTLPDHYVAVSGIDPGAASFVLSLAPLAFASFTAIFAARSGVRASKADAWITGATTGTLVFAAVVTLVALTAANDIAAVQRWQAILFPTLVFAIPLWLGALVTEWREAGDGMLARLRDRAEAARHGWGDTIGLIARGSAVVWSGLIGAGALVLAVSLLLRGGEVIALFEAAHVDALGATVLTLAQAAYLPTLIIWGISFVAGPGFALGVGTTVSPAGTQVGVIPGVPILGAIPESTTPWLLLLALIPIGLGAFAGWIARSRLAAMAPSRTDDHAGPRVVVAIGIAVLSASGAAVLAALASGSIGPGRLAELGPRPGPLALVVGLEVLLGAAILLLSPRRPDKVAKVDHPAGQAEGPDAGVDDTPAPADHTAHHESDSVTEPLVLAPVPYDPDPADVPTSPSGPRRPTLPPSG
jgi:Family of unknown function (DUF6350)